MLSDMKRVLICFLWLPRAFLPDVTALLSPGGPVRRRPLLVQREGIRDHEQNIHTDNRWKEPSQLSKPEPERTEVAQNVIKAASSLFRRTNQERASTVHSPSMEDRSALDRLASGLKSLFETDSGESDGDESDAVPPTHGIQQIVASFRHETKQGRLEDTASFAEMFDVVDKYGDLLKSVWDKFMGNIGHDTRVSPEALWYYVEYEDERKNPSWKRRVHRYMPPASVENLDTLYEFLGFAQLTYLDTAEEIASGLAKAGFQLIYIDLVSEPGRPAHFVAVQTKEDVATSTDELEVLIGVRGTKTVADTMTDLLCDPVDYCGGKAHGFLVRSAKYLAEKHMPMLKDLLHDSGKSKILLSLTGHSLGAGVASIAGIEFNKDDDVYAYVYGYGTPPTLSLGLAEETNTFVTTVVSDADIVPRLSAISLSNLILKLKAFEWAPYAMRDINHALTQLHKGQPRLFSDQLVESLSKGADDLLMSNHNMAKHSEYPEPLEVELYPPGRCIHFFRDGTGLSASVVPNDFFQDIDVSRSMIHGK